MKSFLRFLLSTATILALCGCNFTKNNKAAEQAVATFHQQYNDSKFADIYAGSSAAFKGTDKEEGFIKFIEAVHRKLGAYKSSTGAGWRTNATTSGTFVVLSYDSAFEQGSGRETFTFVVSGGAATLQGYHIDSKDLIVN